MHSGSGDLHPDLVMATVIEKTGWTFFEYESQPVWVIKLLLLKWNIENQYARDAQKK